MACKDFDGQVVRLERIKEVADRFVRVRLTRIDPLDLNLFDFDYDLTFVVFFLNAEEKVYARYGGRDAENPDRRQSLAGLRYTMESVLRMHERDDKAFAPKVQEAPRFIRDVSSFGRVGRCLHCHQVKEMLNAKSKTGKSNQELAWRYPLPENIGLTLEVDRGDIGSIYALVNLRPVETPGLDAEWHVLLSVVVMVERPAIDRRVKDTETNHRKAILSALDGQREPGRCR